MSVFRRKGLFEEASAALPEAGRIVAALVLVEPQLFQISSCPQHFLLSWSHSCWVFRSYRFDLS